MFDPGDLLAFQSSGIPWLIWIQLVVLFLLIALLYCFTVFALDSSGGDASTAAATEGPTTAESASTSRFLFDDIRQVEKSGAKHDSATTTFVINHRQDTQGGENRNIKGEVSAGTTGRIVSAEEVGEREGSSRFLHPCHYFQLARVAFLKCLGLDPASDTPPPQKRRKPKQS